MFHFNKKHLEDQTIPMWIIKLKGESYYVDHVDCSVPWSTKETPENSHTKGAIKVKDCLVQIDSDNCATVSPLTVHDEIRIKNKEKGITRVIVSEKNFGGAKLKDLLKERNFKHGPVKTVGGNCSTMFYITDIFNEADVTYLAIVLSDTDFRVLKPNEGYYKRYDSNELYDDNYDDNE